jgi:glycosyltransferase involved in cell wall biosynthesis
VVTDSQSTREDLTALLGIDADRVDVVPLGIGTLRREEPLGEAEVRGRFDLGQRRIVLSLSAKRPHKNLTALIDALALMPRQRRPLVVVPGYRTWHERELRERASLRQVDNDIRFLNWLFGGELEGLWAICDGFVFPSLYEGFGLPVLEAMARGVPVACSDASSLPEVAGDAALLFDPHDPRAIATATEELLRPERAAQLRASGLRRAREFTWERTARATLDSYSRALASA